jgi:hypothetical protein
MKLTNKVDVTDVYAAVADGRPKKLVRTFDSMAQNMHFDISGPMADGSGPPAFDSASELEGKTVTFTWNDEKSDYDVAFAEKEGDASLLEGLFEDMDLRVFLPAKEVAEDETWEVPLSALESLFSPGGDLKLRPEGVEVDEEQIEAFKELFANFHDDLEDLFSGECVCTYEGSRDEGGTRVAEISVSLEVAGTIDLSEVIQKVIEAAGEQAGQPIPPISLDTADLNLDFDGAGTLLWDLAAGRVHSFTIQGDASIGVDVVVGIEVEGESHGFDASIEMTGTVREEVETKE